MKKKFTIIAALLITGVLLSLYSIDVIFSFNKVEDAASMPLSTAVNSDSSLRLPNPPQSFSGITNLGVEAEVVFTAAQLEQIPPGGHYQGIQLYKGEEQNYLFLSHDSSELFGYLVIAEQASLNRWEAQKILFIDYEIDNLSGPLKHAGGFQICNHYLAVGIEDNRGKRDSQVIFYDISSPTSPLHLSNLTIKRSSAEEKSKTAGAVALIDYTLLGKDGYLIAVANWDAKDVDFYFLEGDLHNLNQSPYQAELIFTWSSAAADLPWGSYQSINFVKDNLDNLYLLGTHTGSKFLGFDYLDLFSVNIDPDYKVEITSLDSKPMRLGLYSPLSKKPHYIYAGGIFAGDEGTIIALAAARANSRGRVAVNMQW